MAHVKRCLQPHRDARFGAALLLRGGPVANTMLLQDEGGPWKVSE